MILHIPHSSRSIPGALRGQFVLDDTALEQEVTLLTDASTDELFDCPGACRVVFPHSRLVVDVERFPRDRDEPMSGAGQGMIYTKTCLGAPLRRVLSEEERRFLKSEYYVRHHELLRLTVLDELLTKGSALIVDCHSYPCRPLPCDACQDENRTDFCIGTDEFHTPPALLEAAASAVRGRGYSVGINSPYSGTLVPSAYYRKNPDVRSVMIEVNRKLYLDERTGIRTSGFETLRDNLRRVLETLDGF